MIDGLTNGPENFWLLTLHIDSDKSQWNEVVQVLATIEVVIILFRLRLEIALNDHEKLNSKGSYAANQLKSKYFIMAFGCTVSVVVNGHR